MSELIKVDFKSRAVVERVDLEKPEPPKPEWSAAKDPGFKTYVEAMVHIAEASHKAGHNWRRMIIVLQPDKGDDETCYTIWDSSTMNNEQASDCLMLAANKVDSLIEEVEPNATT